MILMGCGDIGPIHESGPAGYVTDATRAVLASADLRFAQCERLYSTRGERQLGGGSRHGRLDPSMAGIFGDLGIDVVSVAGNHAMDWGVDAFLDTIDALEAQGIQVVGGGRTMAEARRPVVVVRDGLKVAFLAYCTVLREGYAAEEDRAGVAPLRARTWYEDFDYQPGVPPRVHTIADQDDLAAMEADIGGAKALADVVIVSFHWGIHFIPKLNAEYQFVMAAAATAAGADVIVGHHPHLPKAVETYGPSVCFHSLGNFIMSFPDPSDALVDDMYRDYGAELEPSHRRLPFGPDAKRSLIARVEIGAKGVTETSFLPVRIDEDLRPDVLVPGSEQHAEAVAYMRWASDRVPHHFCEQPDGRVVVTDPRTSDGVTPR